MSADRKGAAPALGLEAVAVLLWRQGLWDWRVLLTSLRAYLLRTSPTDHRQEEPTRRSTLRRTKSPGSPAALSQHFETASAPRRNREEEAAKAKARPAARFGD